MRVLVSTVLASLLFSPFTARAQQPKRFDGDYFRASFVYVVGSGLDTIASSTKIDGIHYREANPLWKTKDGKFSNGKNLAYTFALYGAMTLVNVKWPKMARRVLIGVGIVRGIVGSVTFTL